MKGTGVRLGTNGAFTSYHALSSMWIVYQSHSNNIIFHYDLQTVTYGHQTDYDVGGCIRLIKDNSTNTGSMTGNDGQTYSTISINGQVWMAENSRETKYRNGDTIPSVSDATTWSNLTTGAKCCFVIP